MPRRRPPADREAGRPPYTRPMETTLESPSRAVRSASAGRTFDLGRRLAQMAEPGDTVALYGPLGAGKTVLAKGIGAGLGVASVVNSPTFVLMNEHAGRLRLFHVDAYRLADADEAAAAGLLDDRGAAGVTVVEWADRISSLLPRDRLDLTLEPMPDGSRQVRWVGHGRRGSVLADGLDAIP